MAHRRFVFTPMEAVHYGEGSLAFVPQELERLRSSRVLVLTTRSLADSTCLADVGDGAASVADVHVVPTVSAHLPFAVVDELLAAAWDYRPDTVVTLGGGSVTDAGKAVCAALAHNARTAGDLHRREWSNGAASGAIPQIAIPTTLSAAEYNGAFAMSHDGVKDGYLDIALTPRVVVLDPDASATTPDWLWASTGVRALDHAIETYISSAPTEPTDAAAVHAAKLLLRALPQSLGGRATRDARMDCLIGAWLSFFGVHNAMVGLSHGIGHQLGARFGTPHGVTSCIILPVVVRLLAERRPDRTGQLARELHLAPAGAGDRAAADCLADAVAAFVDGLGVPTRLSELDLPEDGLDTLPDAALAHTTARFAPFPVERADVCAVLEQAR